MTSSSHISKSFMNHVINGSELSLVDAQFVDKMRNKIQVDNDISSYSQNIALQSLPNAFAFANTNSSFSASNSEFSTPTNITRQRKTKTPASQINTSISAKRSALIENDDNESNKRSKNLNSTRHNQSEASIAVLFRRIRIL